MATETHVSHPTVPPAYTVGSPSEARVLWVLWLTYGSFYFCRQNIAAAVPGIKADLNYDEQQIGFILGGLKLAYAFGQLVNGQLAERLSARRLLALGMFGSAGLNLVFGFATGFYFLLFVWACNGYCQALGWTPCLRVAAGCFRSEHRGRLIGILGTSYQVTASLTFVVAGFSVDWLGWRGAFYVPALLLAAAGVHMLFFLRDESPTSRTLGEGVAPAQATANSFRDNILATLSNPSLWFLAWALFFLDACRYGFTDWGLTHLKEVQGTQVGTAALKYAVLPAGGIAGALIAGWATDRYFAGRRAPVMAVLLGVLGSCALVYDRVAQTSLAGTLVLLVVVGFCIFGPQVLLVGTAPADVARRGTAAAAAGFVNFMGYLGAFSGDYVTGILKKHYDWQATVFSWAGWAFAAAIAAACLWNVRPRKANDV